MRRPTNVFPALLIGFVFAAISAAAAAADGDQPIAGGDDAVPEAVDNNDAGSGDAAFDRLVDQQ